MTDAVYADFTCPACYLASLRVDRLLEAGLPAPDWRAVEHRPRLPFTGLRLSPAARVTRDAELAEVRSLLVAAEELPTAAPELLPNTASAVAAYAEAYEAGVADLVRALLFRAYWVDGRDIGDPEVLRRLLPEAFPRDGRTSDAIRAFGYAATSRHGPVTIAAATRIREWQQGWLALGGRVALTVAGRAGTVTGERALVPLAGALTDVAAPTAPVLAGAR